MDAFEGSKACASVPLHDARNADSGPVSQRDGGDKQ